MPLNSIQHLPLIKFLRAEYLRITWSILARAKWDCLGSQSMEVSPGGEPPYWDFGLHNASDVLIISPCTKRLTKEEVTVDGWAAGPHLPIHHFLQGDPIPTTWLLPLWVPYLCFFGQSIIWNNTSWSSIIQFIKLIDHIPVFCLCSPCRAHQLLRFMAYNLFSLIDVVYDCSVLHSGSSVTYLDGPSIRSMSFQSHKYFMFWSSFTVISCLPRRTAAYKLCSVQAH